MHLRNEILIYFLKILFVFGWFCCVGDKKVSQVQCLVISSSTVFGLEGELDSSTTQSTYKDDGESACLLLLLLQFIIICHGLVYTANQVVIDVDDNSKTYLHKKWLMMKYYQSSR